VSWTAISDVNMRAWVTASESVARSIRTEITT